MTRTNGREIDPEKVKYQLDMLVTAIWKNAEEQLRARKLAGQETESQSTYIQSTANPQRTAS